MVMADFLNRNNIDVKQDSGIPYDDRPEGVGKYSYLNTGTMAHALSMDGSGTAYGTYGVDFETADRPEDMSTVMMTGNTELGTYSYYTYVTPESVLDEKPWLKPFQGAMDVLSVVYPPLAPVFQGAGELAETEDLDEALKAAGKTYVVKEVGSELTNAASELTDTVFTDAQIDLSGIPEPVKNVVGDTVGGVLNGESLDDAFTGAITKQTGRAFVGELDIDTEQLEEDFKVAIGLDPNANIPKPLKNIIEDTGQAIVDGKSGSNAFDSSVKSEVTDFVGGVTEEGIKYVAGEAGEALVSAAELAGDLAGGVLGSTIDALGPAGELIESGVGVISDITSEAEDIARAGGRAIDKNVIQPVLGAVEPVIETIEAGGRAVDKNITQPTIKAIGEGIDTISDITSEAEDFVRAGGRVMDKNVIRPTIETAETIIEEGSNILSDTEDFVRAGGRVVDKNVIRPTIKTIDELVRKIPEPPEIDIDLPELNVDLPDLPDLEFPEIDINLPELNVDLPEFTAPDIDLPEIDIDLPSIDVELPELSFDPKLLAGLMPTPQQPTQVEGLFDKELFKFDTEIKSTQEMLSPLMNLRRYG